MKLKIFLLLTIFCLSVQMLSAQMVAGVMKNGYNAEVTPEVKAEAFKLLRETIVEINNLRTLENRISLLAEMASLTWTHDEQEGRQMFRSVISDFTQLLARYDAQLNSFGNSPEEDIYGAYGNTPKAEILRRMMKALSVRQQITKAVATHDPRYALEFYEATAQSITNIAVRKQMAQTDTYFLSDLLAQVAESDAATALEYGRKSVAKGINHGTINLLSKLYEKDAEKGAALGEDIVGKLKSGEETEEYVKISLLNIGEENFRKVKENQAKPPILSEQSMRDIADLLGRQILAREEMESMESEEILSLIEKYAPARALQIRAKFKLNKQAKAAASAHDRLSQMKEAYANVEAETKNNKSPQADLAASMEKMSDDKLSPEEREKVIKQMREIIASLDNRNEKIMGLSFLATQVAGLGDKELALDIMREASGLVSPQPVNYQEYMEVWMLSSGYAAVDSEKAFATLENTIFRLNDTISAFVKVGEFMDVRGEIIEDGEVQMNGFGGNVAQEMLGSLGAVAQPTIRRLAIEDFARTKGLASKFDRMEVRILAKTMILQSVLSENKSVPVKDQAINRK